MQRPISRVISLQSEEGNQPCLNTQSGKLERANKNSLRGLGNKAPINGLIIRLRPRAGRWDDGGRSEWAEGAERSTRCSGRRYFRTYGIEDN